MGIEYIETAVVSEETAVVTIATDECLWKTFENPEGFKYGDDIDDPLESAS